MAATDGATTEDTEAIAVEIKERLFIDVSRGLPAEGAVMPLWSSQGAGLSQPAKHSPSRPAETQTWGSIHLTWAVQVTLEALGTLQCRAVLWAALGSHYIPECWASHSQSGGWF